MPYTPKRPSLSVENVYPTLTAKTIEFTSETTSNGELCWTGVLTGSKPFKVHYGYPLHAEYVFTSHTESTGAKGGPKSLGQKGTVTLGDAFHDSLRTSTSGLIGARVASRMNSSIMQTMNEETKWDAAITLDVKAEGSEDTVSMPFDVAFRIKQMPKIGTSMSSRKRSSANTASSSLILPAGKYTITSEDGETVRMFDLGKGGHVEISEGSGPLFSKELVSSPKQSSGEWGAEATSPKRARKSGEYDDDVKVIEF